MGMNPKTENIVIQILRVIIAIPMGLWVINYLKLESSAAKIFYFFGIYLFISILLEIIKKLVKK